MKVTKFTDGIVICGTFPDEEVVELIRKHGKIRLSVADPPYGNIVKSKWDKIKRSDYEYAMMLAENFSVLESIQDPGHVTCWWGGIGKYKFRPFFKLIPAVEEHTNWQMVDLVTWKKRRGYGVQNKYLFIREELAYFCLGGQKPEIFNVPYLDVERGYPGYNKKYPAKSKYLRRGNVDRHRRASAW